MNRPRWYSGLLGLWIGLGLVACGNQVQTDSTTLINNETTASSNQGGLVVQPSLGQISAATVYLYQATTQQLLATRSLSSGVARFEVPNQSGPFLLKVVPSAGASYFDEATASQQSFPADFVLRTVLNNINSDGMTVAVTPLTEAATQYAQTLGGWTSAHIALANQTIGLVFGGMDILQAPVLIQNQSDYGVLGDDSASRYSYLLAGLAIMARNYLADAGKTQSAILMSQALSADLADGQLDRKGSTMPLVIPYQVADFASNLQTALKTTLVAQLTKAGINLSTQGQSALNNWAISINPLPWLANTAATSQLCGTSKTLSLSDLTTYVGSYDVDIMTTSADGLTLVKTTTLQVLANGSMSLAGVSATPIALCQIVDSSGTTIGLAATVLAGTRQAQIKFFTGGVVLGDDFSVNDAVRVLTNATLTAPATGKLRLISAISELGSVFDPTPTTYAGGVSVGNNFVVNSDGSLRLTWNSLHVLETLSTIAGDVPFRTVMESLTLHVSATGKVTNLFLTYTATNVSGLGTGSFARTDSCLATGCTASALAVTLDSTNHTVNFNKTTLTDSTGASLRLLGTLTFSAN